MQLEQAIIRPDQQVIVGLTRNSLGAPGNFTLKFGDFDSTVRAGLATLITALNQKLPADVSPEVLAEIRQLETRLEELRPPGGSVIQPPI